MDAVDVAVPASSRRALIRGTLVLILALAPSLTAIALVPEFSTQDGPAHLYSARILNAALAGESSPLTANFAVAWQPLPNWAGHLVTMAAVAALPVDIAGRLITAGTLVGFALAVLVLRWAVAGPRGLGIAAVLAALLAMNVTWLLGFTSFLLGATLVPLTLAAWWSGRERFGPGRAGAVAGLLVLGYFCHPIGLGLTVLGLAVLAASTPGEGKVRRAAWTAASLLPLVPLGLAYRAMTRSAGGLEPTWDQLANPWSWRSWVAQAGWVDPISLAAKAYRPFSGTASGVNALASPAVATALGLILLAFATRGARGRRGWAVLAGLLLAGGLFGPDTLGVKHGHYLPQRVALLGLVALVPWLDLAADRRVARVGAGLLIFALAVQSAFVWDYALTCRERVGPLLRACREIGSDRKVGTLLVDIRGRFRSNPLLHADCLVGASSGAVVWTNYETAHYYFPVKVRNGRGAPSAAAFEEVALLDAPGDAGARAKLWAALLDAHGGAIDRVIEWGSDPALDAINARDYATIEGQGPGPARVWTRRPAR